MSATQELEWAYVQAKKLYFDIGVSLRREKILGTRVLIDNIKHLTSADKRHIGREGVIVSLDGNGSLMGVKVGRFKYLAWVYPDNVKFLENQKETWEES